MITEKEIIIYAFQLSMRQIVLSMFLLNRFDFYSFVNFLF